MKDTISFRPRDDAQEKVIEEYRKEKGLKTRADALRSLIDEYSNRYAPPDESCPALVSINEDYRCVFGRIGKTPDIKKLGTNKQLKDAICSACHKTLDMKERLTTLEQQLARGKVIHIPSCKRGAKLNEDMTQLLCPEIGTWRPIKERKKNTDPQPCHAKGSKPYTRCEHIEWTQTVIKGKLPEGQNL